MAGRTAGRLPLRRLSRPHISRLEELRAAIVEERIDAELVLGHHAQLLAELEVLVDRYALRERLRGQLMLALYRAGRQADALRVFQDGRAVLAEELGLDPGPELRALEAAILDQSDALLVTGASTSAPSPAGAAPRTNVKAALTPLVGRASELAELAAILAEQRLVTLVGPGGAGKTRLATELARALIERFADGTFVAELASIGESDDVPREVVAAFDLPDSDADAASRLRHHCRDAELLLVLDNCEHLLDAAATLADDLLSRCPGVRIVATSREALRVSGEVVWPVPPLPPDDSIELFAQRARAADPAFSLDDDTRAIVADVSARLDGLPLAIELAAARTRAFPLDQLRERIERPVPTADERDAELRYRDTGRCVPWSTGATTFCSTTSAVYSNACRSSPRPACSMPREQCAPTTPWIRRRSANSSQASSTSPCSLSIARRGRCATRCCKRLRNTDATAFSNVAILTTCCVAWRATTPS